MNLRERIQNSPPWVGGAISGILFAVLFTTFEMFFERASVSFYLVAAPFEALIFGGVMGLLIARARRASGGAKTASELSRAIKVGRIPDDADTLSWHAGLDWRKRQSKTTLWLGPVIFGVAALLGVWLALSSPIFWLFAALFVAFAIYTHLASASELRRIEKVQAQLGGEFRGGH